MITLSELQKIAALAKLSIEGDDTEKLMSDISEMVEFANAVVGADIQGSAKAVPVKSELRDDTVEPSFDNALLLSNAKEKKNGFYVAEKTGGALGEQNK